MLNEANTPTVPTNNTKLWTLVKPVHCNDARLKRENIIGGGEEAERRKEFDEDGSDLVSIVRFEERRERGGWRKPLD
jgi:hypothetical protein